MYNAVQQREWDGRPTEPERSGWHWIDDGDGLRPLLWRGLDWPEPLDRNEWQDGFAVLSPRDLHRDRYYGPLAMPPAVAALFRFNLRRGSPDRQSGVASLYSEPTKTR